ncbi:hypothetical protein ACMGDM_14700 [Sphingomonas sp. DT-51]|uniref:hypothetical protein n=1 Tax=Sphingomonas sp. DT-51 TaxID=3396165 RepID=UPI003F1DE5CD
MITAQADGVDPETTEEKAWAERVSKLAEEERGYFLEQSTRPQMLGIAMSDSPVGVAAWILEKFGVWADVPRYDAGRPDLWAAFDENLLLTNIMLYVAPRSFVTSTWLYRGRPGRLPCFPGRLARHRSHGVRGVSRPGLPASAALARRAKLQD